MGVVYLGEDPDGHLVAVKVVHAMLTVDPEFRRRFRAEIRRARQVPPFCTAEVLDADPDHEPPYLVVEYVDGPSLADEVVNEGPLSPANVHAVAVGVASALAGIHSAGVIHRDLKPENVLLAPGSPKVIDFGIARAFDRGDGFTRTGFLTGTLAYMAPERLEDAPGLEIGPAADIFAWGAVVAFAATGQPPFRGSTTTALVTRIMTGQANLAGIPGHLRPLVSQALAKDPADRPTARQLVDALLGPTPRGRNPRRWVSASLAFLLLVALIVTLTVLQSRPHNLARPQTNRAAQVTTVTSELNGMCLDIRNSGQTDPRPVQTLNCSGNSDQLWSRAGDGTLRSQNECLDVTADRDKGVVSVGLTTCNGKPTQQWRYTANRNIVNPATSSDCLDIVGSNTNEGADLQLRSCRNTPNQKWILKTSG